MSQTIALKEFGPSVVTEQQGKDIHNLIQKSLHQYGAIKLDFDGIVSMTTYCAKLIFGSLYVELTPSRFFTNIEMVNLSEGMSRTVREGIAAKIADMG